MPRSAGRSRSAAAALATALATVLLGTVAGTPAVGHPESAATHSTAQRAAAVNDCVSTDNGDPDVVGMTLTPSTVDVRGGPQVVQVRVNAVDAGGPGPASGIAEVLVYLSGARRVGAQLLNMRQAPDGAWTGSFTIAPGAGAGRWYVHLVQVQDRVGWMKQIFDEGLTRRGIPHEITVLDRDDIERPELTSFRLARTSLDLSHGTPAAVRVRATARDDVYVASVTVRAVGPRGRRDIRARLHRTPSGAWVGELVLPTRWNADGNYRVGAVVTDGYLRSKVYGPGASYRGPGGPGPGLPARLRVTGGREDTMPPRATVTRVRPDPIDLRTSGQRVTVRVRIRDVGAGIDRAEALVADRAGPFLTRTELRPVSGTRRNGIWRARLTVPRCGSGAGPMTVSVRSRDKAGRRGLESAHSVPVRVADHVAPGFTGQTFGERPVAGPLVFEWTEDVSGITKESAQLLPNYERFNDEPRPTPVPGNWSCKTATGTVVDCVTGPVRFATFSLQAPPLTEDQYQMEFNPPGVLAVTDLAGNPAMAYSWNYS